jgi:pimeloyl-ACP methyl ester carboxylesterase
MGGGSNALWSRFGQTHGSLLDWLPRAEGFVLPGATHGMQMENPRGMAEALIAFWARHPLAAPR